MVDKLKIGVLGGGQLGAMLMRHAVDYGLNIAVLDKDPNAPCSRYSGSFVVGDPMNYNDVMSFGSKLDIITIEMEAVNTQALRELAKAGVKVYPSADVIEIIQDKYTQKKYLEDKGIAVPRLIQINNKAELAHHLEMLPACLKKCKNGYDGKGVMMLYTPADIENAFDEPCILEELIDIKHEISVIVCRNEAGEVICYDPVLMVFNNQQVLDYQLCPANMTEEKITEAFDLAVKTIEAMNMVGILAVEMFLTKEDKLLVNELAPRPHNSGHHTIETCITSQYEQLLRIITGMPLGDTKLKSSSVMVNLFEPAADKKKSINDAMQSILRISGAHVHWYGKGEGKPGRKMGHITISEDTVEKALTNATTIRNILKESYGQE